jgi:predicted amidophosphoribosyltransferase
MIVEPDVVEADLAAGRLCCPNCEGPLSRWGFARERQVRLLDGVRSIRPRRACCQRCDTTHVLLPAWAVPRRRDGAEVIGEALLCKAQGLGHRRIATRLERPPATVRGWLRAFARRAELVTATARRWTHAIDARSLDQIRPAASPLVDAVDALGIVARASRLQLAMSASPWELAVALTGLLHGRPRDPPGF